jgi:hypothetical protein
MIIPIIRNIIPRMRKITPRRTIKILEIKPISIINIAAPIKMEAGLFVLESKFISSQGGVFCIIPHHMKYGICNNSFFKNISSTTVWMEKH